MSKYDCIGNEMRAHDRFHKSSEFGRNTCEIKCPFCGATVNAYVWSLAGGGKRCPCGVIHFNSGVTTDDKNIYNGRLAKGEK